MPTSNLAKALAIVGPLGLSLVLVAFRDQVHAANASLALVVVVLAVALVGGRAAGLVAALVAAACFDFFFTQPYYSLSISSHDDIETTVVLLVVGVTVGELVVRARRSERQAAKNRAAADYLRTSAALTAAGESASYLIHAVERELVVLLGAKHVQFERPPLLGEFPALRHGRVTIPTAPDMFPSATPDRAIVEIRVFGKGELLGRFVIELDHARSGVEIDPDQRTQALALVDQLGGALAGS